MLVYLKDSGGYTSFEGIAGKKVIAQYDVHGGFDVSVVELKRVCSNPEEVDLDAFIDRSGLPTSLFFTEDEITFVEKKYTNCSDLSVGKGWEGWYDQAHVKTSSFR
jgi:glycyl-tRNA synthetase alpha subunit